jgi:hypothetical protein
MVDSLYRKPGDRAPRGVLTIQRSLKTLDEVM